MTGGHPFPDLPTAPLVAPRAPTIHDLGTAPSEPIFDEVYESDASKRVLEPLLEPIMQWLRIREIEEIAINRPGEIWLRLRQRNKHNEKWIARADKRLHRRHLELTIYALANTQNTTNFGPNGTPTTYGTLPGGHRYAAALGANIQYTAGESSTDGTILFVARQNRSDLGIRFEHFGLVPGAQLNAISSLLHRKADAEDPLMRIMAAIKRGDHILISGATGSGKTTLLNHIIRMFSQTLRIVTVEDASEIFVPQANHIHLLLNRNGQSNDFNYKSVVDLVVRITPDVVMAGEISVSNASAVWELMRSGHGHFLSTIHAESAEEAISSFITRIGHSSPNEAADRQRLTKEMKDKLRIIQLTADKNGRAITDVV